ncbi:hypothetical protein C1645_764172 [Glomus cerebriforme]|uniref:Late embryogenesis abundant protein LEA-2 subgroup domain-containing protein n=1 Tax=Glomus cerebriforme TaxID=658196 RepID=A0A397T8R1_9GLOM|nr:hypothetical protein C1645_764172 [Glomus cerebriforme]
MAYNNNNNNNDYYQQNQQNQQMSGYYNNQGDPSASTSNYHPTRVQELNRRYLTELDTGNNSSRSLGGATAIGTPHVNPSENSDEVDSINSSSLYSHQQGGYNHQDQEAMTRDPMAYPQQPFGQPKYSMDEGENPSSHSGSILSKRDSTAALTSTHHQQLIGQSTYDLGDRQFSDFNQSSGYYPQYNKYHQDDPYYDEEATRHNTLTSVDPNVYGFEHDYTDRDFPGGGKGARQSMTGEHLVVPEYKRKRGCRCCCCSWPVCILITVIILVGLGVTAFFVLPRKPTVNVKDAIPASVPVFNNDPPSIYMNFTMVVEIDNNENYVPYKFNKVDVSVFDRTVNNANSVATGTKLDYTLQPKQVDTLDFPLTVNYTGQSLNDPVLTNFIAACSPNVKKHTPLKLRVDVVLFIWGIDWIYQPKISVPIPDMKCPDLQI